MAVEVHRYTIDTGTALYPKYTDRSISTQYPVITFVSQRYSNKVYKNDDVYLLIFGATNFSLGQIRTQIHLSKEQVDLKINVLFLFRQSSVVIIYLFLLFIGYFGLFNELSWYDIKCLRQRKLSKQTADVEKS